MQNSSDRFLVCIWTGIVTVLPLLGWFRLPACRIGLPIYRFAQGFAIHIMSLGATAFVVFGVLSVVTLKELNTQVTEPYMVSHASGASFSVVASAVSCEMWVIG